MWSRRLHTNHNQNKVLLDRSLEGGAALSAVMLCLEKALLPRLLLRPWIS